MARIPLVTRDQIVEKDKPAYDAFMLCRANRAGGAPLRDAAALGPALGAPRLPRAGVADASHVASAGQKRLDF